MPKLTKEQTQKLVIGTIGFIILIYVYFSFFLGPLKQSSASMLARTADLQDKIASSKSEMTKTIKLEEQAHTATSRYAALCALSPEGAPLAWFPPRIKAFFANQKIDRASARLESTSGFGEKELAQWNKYVWVIDIPQADFNAFGNAVAQLEDSEPLLSISKLRIHVGSEDPAYQQVLFTASTIINKQ